MAVRWDIGRRNHAVAPGLYAIGSPTPDSPLLATANYKVSFDVLRTALNGLDTWVLVVDTQGINVWCAAGKGTFGTEELVQRLAAVKAAGIVNHATLILPQLAAPGVAAHEVRRQSGFRVVYGLLRDVATLRLDAGKCIGCGRCVEVCPHRVFVVEEHKSRIVDRDACMECGACAQNCPVDALWVKNGVGCAVGILNSVLGRKGSCCGEDQACCCADDKEPVKARDAREA